MRKHISWIASLVLIFCLATVVFTACNPEATEEPTYTVTYVDGVDNEEITVPVDTTEYKQGDKVTVKDEINRAGYSFEGWGYGTAVLQPGEKLTMPANNVTLTAKWEPLTTYSVTYDLGEDYEGDSKTPTETPKYAGATFTIADAPSMDGYKFMGWNDGTKTYDAKSTYTMPEGEVTLTAVWAKLYTVTYNLGNNYEGDSKTPTEGSHLDGETFTLADAPSMDGYAFLGWDDGDEIYDAGDEYTISSSNVTLTAVWAEYHTVTYALDGGTYNGGTTAPTETPKYTGQTFKLATSPTKTEYYFAGWSDGTNVVAAGQTYIMPDDDVTFTAVWTLKLYTVRYDLGDEYEGESEAPTETDKAAGVWFDLADAPSMDGYEFVGWTDDDGTTIYPEGSSYEMPSKNVTLTAVWSKLYNVTFDLGEYDDEDGDYTDGYYAVGTIFELKVLSMDGYTFLGWYTLAEYDYYDEEGMKTRTAYEVISVTTTLNYTLLAEDTDIRALWKADDPKDLGVGAAASVRNVNIGKSSDNAIVFELKNVPAGDYEISFIGSGTLRTSRVDNDGEARAANIKIVVGEKLYTISGTENSQYKNIEILEGIQTISVYADAVLVDVTVRLTAVNLLKLGIPKQVTIPESGKIYYELYLGEGVYAGDYVITLEGDGAENVKIYYADENGNAVSSMIITPGKVLDASNGQKISFTGTGGATFTATITVYEPDPYKLTLNTPLTGVEFAPLNAAAELYSLSLYLDLEGVTAGNKYTLTISDVTATNKSIAFEIYSGGGLESNLAALGSLLTNIEGQSATFTLPANVSQIRIRGYVYETFTATLTLTEYAEQGQGEANTAPLEVDVEHSNTAVGASDASPNGIALGESVTQGNYTLTITNHNAVGSVEDEATYYVSFSNPADEDQDLVLDANNNWSVQIEIPEDAEYIYLYSYNATGFVTLLLTEGTTSGGGQNSNRLVVGVEARIVTEPTQTDGYSVSKSIYLEVGTYTITLSGDHISDIYVLNPYELNNDENVVIAKGEGTATIDVTTAKLYEFIFCNDTDSSLECTVLFERERDLTVGELANIEETAQNGITKTIYLAVGTYRITVGGDHAARIRVINHEGLVEQNDYIIDPETSEETSATFTVAEAGVYSFIFVDLDGEGSGCTVLIEAISGDDANNSNTGNQHPESNANDGSGQVNLDLKVGRNDVAIPEGNDTQNLEIYLEAGNYVITITDAEDLGIMVTCVDPNFVIAEGNYSATFTVTTAGVYTIQVSCFYCNEASNIVITITKIN